MPLKSTYRVMGNHGISFETFLLTINPDNRCKLRETRFPPARHGTYEVARNAAQVYDRMLAGDRPCLMKVTISDPLNRHQADTITNTRTNVARYSAAAAGASLKPLGTIPATVGGAVTYQWVSQWLGNVHTGDILVNIEAEVNGGIGPQRSSRTLTIKA